MINVQGLLQKLKEKSRKEGICYQLPEVEVWTKQGIGNIK